MQAGRVADDIAAMNANRSGSLWTRLALWPRLAIAVTVGFGILFAGFSVLGIRAVDASTSRILHERLVLTQELAEDVDGLLERSFAQLAAYGPGASSAAVDRLLVAQIYRGGANGVFSSVALLDARGRVRLSLGRGGPAAGTPLGSTAYVARVLAGAGRSISGGYRDAAGRPVVALAVPVRRGGSLAGVLVGTIDLAGAAVMERLDMAERLERTGHAELVGPGGIALASTEAKQSLRPGEHLAFYRTMLAASAPAVADVAVSASAGDPVDLRGQRHVMAFARLTQAPWGVALGGTESDTYAPAQRLRRTLMLAGGGSLAVLWLLTLLGARILVRPVRTLTRSAEEMASGDLEQPVSVSEGGEIGVLGESLETMRVQLKESLATVRSWGEQLELKVAERTGELNARNRQLAAVSAIMTVANEAHDLESLLLRCLDVVCDETGVDAAAVQLLERPGGAPAQTVVRGAEGDAVAVLPLRGPSGVLGHLTLRGDGAPPGPGERAVLVAICDQIAVAVENAHLAAELARLEAQREVDRLRSELISAVSHELRTPLGFIKGYATTLLRDDTPIEPATRRAFLEIIDEETDKLAHMIEDLLDASRLQAGRLPIEQRPVQLRTLLGHAVEKARPSLEAERREIDLRLPPEEPVVLADPLRIEQVLDNLLQNASRYSEPGSPIEIGLVVAGADALLNVTNRGNGLAPDELERIFEPFYRGRSARARQVRGTGLGLAISRGIVQAHDGRIWGEVDGGRTTFLVALPLLAEAA